MDIQNILSHTEHTNLNRITTWEEVKNYCDDAMKYGCSAVCIPPCFVNNASEYINGRTKVATVVGFPAGYSESYIKISETEFAILDGVDEIDLAINLCQVKDKRFDLILNEINAVKKKCEDKLLKVVIEASLLDDEEIVKICEIVTKSNADYIVTSTGFGHNDVGEDTVALIMKNIGENIKVKATVNLETLAQAEKLIALGVAKIGSSKVIKLMKQS